MKHRKIKNKIRERSGFSLLSVVFAMLALGAVGVGMTQTLSVRSQGTLKDYLGKRAFYIAEAGMQYVLSEEFYDSSNFLLANSVTNKSFADGTFSAAYSDVTATSATVTVTAQLADSERQIQQAVALVPPVAGAMHAGGNIELLRSEEEDVGTITGDLVYGGTYLNEGGYTVTGTAESGPGPDSVNLTPLIDLTTDTHSGNLAISGIYANNIYVTGNVTITGTTTISGIIVADGNITITTDSIDDVIVDGTLAAGGNIVGNFDGTGLVTQTAQMAGGEMQPVLLAGGNIDYYYHQATTHTINGLIKAGGNFIVTINESGLIQINGAIETGGNITIDAHENESTFNVDVNAGSPFLDTTFQLSNWKEL